MPLPKLLQQKSTLLVSLLLAATVFATFLPTLNNGFVNYDDPVYVYANPHVAGGLTWANVQWAFGTFEGGIWHPLTWLSIMLDCELFGRDAGGHHLTSLLLHTGSTVLLFLVLRRLTGAQWRSALVAALFGLHPLHVESVAWASERKDVLSAFFFMLTLYAYAEYAARIEEGRLRLEPESALEPPRSPLPVPNRNSKIKNQKSWYLLSLAFFTLGLMSKAMLVTLPVLLLLLDFWPLNRFPTENQKSKIKNLLLEKLPFLALALAAGSLTWLGQKHLGAVAPVAQLPLWSRCGNAVLSYALYLFQMIWPLKLAVFYSYHRTISPGLAGALLVVGLVLSVGLLRSARARPYLAVGWLWYLVMLLPVIGLVQVGSQAHADRYTYLPLIGIFIALAWGAAAVAAPWHCRPGLLAAGAALGLLPCAWLSHQQTGCWKDSLTLWRHALAVTRDNAVAHGNLGATLDKQGHTAAAIAEYQESLRLAPRQPNVRIHLGVAFATQGQVGQAIAQFQEALRLDPNNLDAHYNLGVALVSQRRYDEALRQFQEALRIRPGYPRAEANVRATLAAKAQAAGRAPATRRP